jgi:hypothetical protein
MSGSSDGGGIPYLAPQNEKESCETLVVNTNLTSPQANVVNTLIVGDILNVQAASDQGPIQVLDQNGHVAGNIMSREQIRLLNCIIGGTQYIAEILTINNGQCSIQVRAR